MGDKIISDALALVAVIESLKLPKGSRIRGTRDGTEIHRPDGISYLIKPLAPEDRPHA